MTTKYVVVLVAKGDRETWFPCGEIEVALGTKRQTIIDRVLEGQIAPDVDVAGVVPQLRLQDGAVGELLLIPAGEVSERLPVRAAMRYAVAPAVAQNTEEVAT